MSKLKVSIVPPLSPPEEGSNLVVFASSRNYTAEYDSAKMLSAARRYAKKYNCYTVPERFSAQGFLCLCLFSPLGEPLAVQQACHLNFTYRGVFKRADAIEVFDTDFGKVALIVDVDANKPQVIKTAVLKGARIIVTSQFIQPFDFYEDRVLHSVVNASLTNSVAVVGAISSAGIILDSLGVEVVPYSETLPLFGKLSINDSPSVNPNNNAMMDLLLTHRHNLIDVLQEGGNDKN